MGLSEPLTPKRGLFLAISASRPAQVCRLPLVLQASQSPLERHSPFAGSHVTVGITSLLRGLFGPRLGDDFHGLRRFRHRRLQPRGSSSSDVDLTILLPLAVAGIIRRPARSAGYPCPVQARTVPPGRLHSSTGFPYLVSLSGLLRGLPGVSLGRPFDVAVALNLAVPALRYGPL